MGKLARHFWELEVYHEAFEFQQEVFELTRAWPRCELYSLTNQLRRSTRSVGANLAEAWAKRRYPAHFLTKLTDSDGEIQETCHWLRTAAACDYLNRDEFVQFSSRQERIGRMLGNMITRYEEFRI